MKVTVNKPKVSSATIGGEFVLLHVPTDNFVTLDQKAQKIWKSIEAGNAEVETIVEDFSKEHKLPRETASVQVISFLSELRNADLIEFDLDKNTGPLIDMLVKDLHGDTGAPVIQKLVIHEAHKADEPIGNFLSSNKLKPKTVVDRPNAGYRLGELVPSLSKEKNKKLLLTHAPDPKLTLDQLTKLAGTAADTIVSIDNPKEEFLLGDLLQINQSFPGTVAVARIIVVVVIIFGPIIIIVIIDGGPGPARGKSRSACKTMCV
jgi:hypothetical protein